MSNKKQFYFLACFANFVWCSAIALVFAIVLSCQKKKDSARSDFEFGNELIKNQKYSEAIEYFSRLNKSHPNSENRIALATAYSGRAGFKIDNYWGFVIGYKDVPEPIDKKKLEEKIRELVGSDLVDQNKKEFTRISSMLILVAQRFVAIPILNEAQIQDIFLAQELLKNEVNRGVAIFRGVLEIVILRYQISLAEKNWQTWIKGDSLQNVCFVGKSNFIVWAQNTLASLIQLRSDLILAFPSEKRKINSAFGDLDDLSKMICEQSTDQIDEPCL